jgi:nicotinamide riboside transporter PnuC
MLGLISWVASALELWGVWAIGSKNKWGFILNMLGSLLWVAVAVFGLPATGLLLVVVPAVFINIRNFLKWKKQEKKND